MINITFNIDEFPLDRSQPYSLVAGVEGKLIIVNDEHILFQEPGILLLEFSNALESWLNKIGADDNADFYYASMDFEEEPIVAFEYKHNESVYRFASVWGMNDGDVARNELVNASKLFINELNSEIQKQLEM